MTFAQLRKYIFSSDSIVLFLSIGIFLIAGTFNLRIEKPVLNLTKQDTALNVNNNLLLFMNAGNKRLITDLIWIQTLLESDLEHYNKRDLNSWLFLRFNTISILDPKFYENYLYGGQFLFVIKDDLEGASILLEKGINQYPDDYKLNYFQGFNYYFEKQDYASGFKYIKKVQDYPQAPPFLKSIVNKMQFEMTFDYDLALEFLSEQLKNAKDESIRKKLTSEILAVSTERDLDCLNKRQENCRTQNVYGEAYQFKNGTYTSPRAFTPYRLKKKGEVKTSP